MHLVSSKNKVNVWNIENRGFIELEGHTEGINSVDWTPDGTKIVTTSDDQSVRIWDLISEKEITSCILDVDASIAKFSPDGKYLAVGDNLGEVILYEIVGLDISEPLVIQNEKSKCNFCGFIFNGFLI